MDQIITPALAINPEDLYASARTGAATISVTGTTPDGTVLLLGYAVRLGRAGINYALVVHEDAYPLGAGARDADDTAGSADAARSAVLYGMERGDLFDSFRIGELEEVARDLGDAWTAPLTARELSGAR